MKPKKTITLNEMEQALARSLAKAWKFFNDANWIDHPNISGAPTIENNTNAIGAELAYCKLNNIYPNLEVGDYKTYDATLQDGTKMNVKWSSHEGETYDLIVVIKNYRTYPDAYALMTGTFPTYTYQGWIEKEKVIKPERINYKLPKPAYAWPRAELRR